MERLVLAGVLVLAAVAISVLVQRRRRTTPFPVSELAVPAVVDRKDFERPSAPWLLVVFTSATCDTCARAVEVVGSLAVDHGLPLVVVEHPGRADLHDRYAIEAVPATLIVDEAGLVRHHVLGRVVAEDLSPILDRLLD